MPPIRLQKSAIMMNLKVASFLLSFYVLTSLFSYSQAAVSIDKQGSIKAEEVLGSAYLIDPITGYEVPLFDGMIFNGGYMIETTANSRVTLLFSNGSGIYLYENSLLKIEDFYQIPFDESLGTFKELTRDPSPSYAWLKLERGELAGHVKKLTAQSSFVVETPDAIGDIRGTIFGFRHSDKFAEGDVTRSQISVFEGSVATVTKSALSSTELNSLRNFADKNTTPFENMLGELGTTQTLTVTNQPQSTTISMSNITSSELSNFGKFISGFARDLGAGREAVERAILNASGGTATSTGSPTKFSEIKSSKFDTENGNGFRIDVTEESTDFGEGTDFTDDITVKKSQTILGTDITDSSTGKVRTATQNTTTIQTLDATSAVFKTTTFQSNTDQTRSLDGSWTLTRKTTSTTVLDATSGKIAAADAGTITSTFQETSWGNQSGESVQNITQTTTLADGTTTTKTIRIENGFDANGKLITTTTTDDNGTTTTTTEASTTSDSIQFSKDTSIPSLTFTGSSINLADAGTSTASARTVTSGSQQVTLSVIEAVQNGTTFRFTPVTKTFTIVTSDGRTVADTIEISDGTNVVITNTDSAETNNVTTTVTRLRNGGYKIVTIDGDTTTTFTRSVADNGVVSEVTETATTATTGTTTTTITTTVNADGTVTVTDGTNTRTFDSTFELIQSEILISTSDGSLDVAAIIANLDAGVASP